MTRKPSNPDDDTAERLQELLGNVKPLVHNKIDPDSRPKTRFVTRTSSTSEDLVRFTEREYAPGVAADEILSFARDGVQPKIMTKLKKGQYPFNSQVDLHGSTISEAGVKLQQALNTALASHDRCILIVHGRGKGSINNRPAIKSQLNQWLRDSPNVLAFHSALAQHGGTGAVYVLLKRQREK
jgi:DNA-nicking Smr family endonuclease